jgi:sulfite exporter TauE/SafE
VSALVILLIVAALATAGAWAFELKHERLRKDLTDGTQARQPDADA